MKKLLPAIAMSFVLSGCLNSVSLPNTNTQGSSNSYELDYLGVSLGFSEVCKKVNPKQKKKWERYQGSIIRIVDSYNKTDRERVWTMATARMIAAYTSKNNIPFTGENIIKIGKQFYEDERFRKAVLKEAVIAMKEKKDCFDFNSSEKSLKEFATKIGKGHLL